jgi:hypothetical protein
MADLDMSHVKRMQTEHDAWLAVVSELRKQGVGDINMGGEQELLHDLIVAWGEELAQLRMADPNPAHAIRALAERRAKIDAWNEADNA